MSVWRKQPLTTTTTTVRRSSTITPIRTVLLALSLLSIVLCFGIYIFTLEKHNGVGGDSGVTHSISMLDPPSSHIQHKKRHHQNHHSQQLSHTTTTTAVTTTTTTVPTVLLVTSTHTRSQPFKIYIYNWSEEITNRWPKQYKHKRLSTEAKFQENHGAGPLVDQESGLYHTHQYALFTLFVERLRARARARAGSDSSSGQSESYVITDNPDEANGYFIPYDIGMDSSTRVEDGALTATNCPQMTSVLQQLHKSPYFQRKQGKDHFMIHSINHMMLFFMNKQCRQFYQPEIVLNGVGKVQGCYHCVKYGIDLYDQSLFDVLKKLPEMTHNWYSIPFPSNYHYDALTTTRPPWVTETVVPRVTPPSRPYVMTFVGTTEVSANKQKELREMIVTICQSHTFKAHCLWKELESHSSNVNMLLSTPSSSASDASAQHPYRQATFCFSPGGDFPTRKGFLDAMLSGCIPITFQLASAQQQWLAHWGSLQVAMDCTVFIDRDDFMQDPIAFFNQLIEWNKNSTFVNSKLAAIRTIAYRFQYSRPFDESSSSTSRSSSYHEDAVDIAIQHFVNVIS